MKKLILSSLFVFAAMFAVNAQDSTTTDANAPEITFESETVDYGTIEKGSDPIRMVKFTNTGKSPLIITNCKGSCGCTVPTCPKDPIMPGESATLQVKFDTKRVGPINKTVTVSSNASNGTKYLKVTGKVEPAQEAFPAKNAVPAEK